MIPSLTPIVNSGLLNHHTSVLVFNALQVVNIFAQFKGESDTPMPYSKFAQGKTAGEKKRVSSRSGMLIIYVPANIVALLFMLSSSAYTQAALMCLIHFLKRNLEVLFLHKYSGTVELEVSQLIGSFYAFITFMICLVSRSEVDPQVMQLAQALFCIGILGNFYHHYLLASLRKNGAASTEQKEYHPPKGGFFEFVAAPHYLFELIGWLGIAFASQDMTAFLAFTN
eukprot:CAMPEP_0113646292 /NCGR_PEP_ID=MMETSP0017_2-20120614/24445_1 /TAXON_ID=2856 /ORGANISM="Cylindrotheca closterium" /LENGTH=225 /DNA_ID=CAMNT_0000558163 /DNA_START=53 /DNA_END=727 /DNA_ORIENTATION=+ /assembly_acc=CAM_ASM_000147